MSEPKTKWERLAGGFIPFDIPAKPGVYVAFADGSPIYIGQAINLRSRIGGYKIDIDVCSNPPIEWITPWGRFARFHMKVSVGGKYGSWAMREMRLIRRLKPQFNHAHVGQRDSS